LNAIVIEKNRVKNAKDLEKRINKIWHSVSNPSITFLIEQLAQEVKGIMLKMYVGSLTPTAVDPEIFESSLNFETMIKFREGLYTKLIPRHKVDFWQFSPTDGYQVIKKEVPKVAKS
jgi:hypothetical protein